MIRSMPLSRTGKDTGCYRRTMGIAGGALLLMFLSFPVPSSFGKEIYPAKRIKWVVPYKAGGGLDLVSRGMGQYLTKYLREVSPGAKGGDLVIKNEPAGGSLKGIRMVYGSDPDGYTIGSFDMAIATESLMKKLDFDMRRFTYLFRIQKTTRVMVTSKSGFASWDALIKASKVKELKWGVGTFGRAMTVDSIIVKERVGIPARLIPWDGAANAMNALLRGDIQMALLPADSTKALYDAGEIRLLATFTEKSEFPGVPTIKELGYADLADKLGSPRYVIAPPGLPRETRNILSAAFKKVLNDKEFQAWATKTNMTFDPLYGEEANKGAQNVIRYYQEDLKPLLSKYLEQ